MIIKKCPRCKSEKIEYFAAALTGQYHCKKCGYTGPIVLEQDIPEKKIKKQKLKTKNLLQSF